MCNLCRILINCLLLISMVSAVPLVRQKRKISFFKDLFTSTFYGNDGRTLQIPDVRAEPDCMIYIVPGYSDILPQPVETAADEIAIPNIGKKERKLSPKVQKSHIGTHNSADTTEAIKNERNSLSTVISKVPETRMRDDAVPMIKGRNAMKFVVEENIIPGAVIVEPKIQTNRRKVVSFPRRSGRIRTGYLENVKNHRTIPVFPVPVQQVIPEKLAPNGRLRYLKPVDPRYSPRLIVRTGPKIRFTPRSYPDGKTRDNFITLQHRPMQGIDEVITLAEDEYDIIPEIGNYYSYSRQRFIPSGPEYYIRNIGRKIVPLNPRPLPLVEFDKHEVINKHSSHVNKSIRDKITADENNTLKVLTPKPYHSSNITTTDNITKNIYDAQIDKTVSPAKDLHYSKQFNIAKEKDEINTSIPFANDYVSESPVKSTTPTVMKTKDKILSKDIVKTGEHLPKSETLAQYIKELVRNNKTHPVDLEKFKDELQTNFNTDFTNFTDIDSILDIVSMNMYNSNVTIPKIKDLAVAKHNIDIAPIIDVMPLNNKNNPNIIKPTDIKTKDETTLVKLKDVNFSEEMNIRVNHTDSQSLSKVEDRNNSQVIENNSSSHNLTEKNNIGIVKINDKVVKSDSSNKNISTILNNSSINNTSNANNRSAVKTNDNTQFENSNINVADKVSNNYQNIDFRLRDIISNLLYILDTNNEPKTNINKNPTLTNQNISYSQIIENLSPVLNGSNTKRTTSINPQNKTNIAPEEAKIKTNVVTTSPLSIGNDYKLAITNPPPVNYTADQISDDKKETINTTSTTVSSNIKLPVGDTTNDQVPSKGNSIVATDDGVSIKQNKVNDSSSTNGNDEKSNNVSETIKSRGDIPDASF